LFKRAARGQGGNGNSGSYSEWLTAKAVVKLAIITHDDANIAMNRQPTLYVGVVFAETGPASKK